MTFFFQFCGPADVRKPWETEGMLDSFRQSLRAAAHPRYKVADDEPSADIVVLVESVARKDWRYLNFLLQEPVLRRRADSCFAINYDDDAMGYLSGLYAGLSATRHDPLRHRATGYLLRRTERVDSYAAMRGQFQPRLLFSFRGADSHPIRAKLFATEKAWRRDARIARIDRWFDHTAQEEIDYFEEILGSHFVLCPRGIAATSHRLFEVMQLGRVPVILSDEWVAPNGPDWPRFAIRLAESKLDLIPELLRARLGEAEELGRQARSAWEQWFSPEKKMGVAAAAIEELALMRPAGFDALDAVRQALSLGSRWRRGWTLPQRALHRLTRKIR